MSESAGGEAPSETVTVALVFYESANGRDGWRMVRREEVPDWLLNEETMKKLLQGEMAMRPEIASGWYRVETVHEEVVQAALADDGVDLSLLQTRTGAEAASASIDQSNV